MVSKLARFLVSFLVIFTMNTPLAFGQEELTAAETEPSTPIEVSTATFVSGSSYTGTWIASGYRDLPSRIIIISTDGDTANILYQWGDKVSAGAQPGGEREYTVSIQDNQLKWGELGERKPIWTFVLSPDGKTLKGHREEIYKGQLVASDVIMKLE